MTDSYVDEGEYEDTFEEEADLYYPVDEPYVEPGPARFAELEGRSTWMYLGLLVALFVLLVGFSWACDDGSTTPVDLLPSEGADTEVAGNTVARLNVAVDGGIVTLTGSVPDEGAKEQILTAARDQYGPENVIDELVVDPGFTLEGGVVSITGSTEFGDDRPEALREAVVSALGLTVAEFSVEKGDAAIEPVALSAVLESNTVRISGVVPDDAAILELTAAGEAVWGSGTVDVSGVTVGDATFEDGRVVLTGTTAPGDQRYEAFPAEIRNRFGPAVEVDTSGVTVDAGAEALAGVQTQIQDAVTADPILFAPVSADIDPASDAVLQSIATLLATVPDATVEIVGHTDDQGGEQENLVLSEDRAKAVLDRLVELGVDQARLTARGEGEAAPIASNDTADGRAQNRRIEFLLGG